MSFVTILSDPFIDDVATSAGEALNQSESTQQRVRRPTFGVLHGEEYFAYISVKSSISDDILDTQPKYVSIIDSSSPNGTSRHNHNFMLTQVDFALQEKAQIVQTFGTDYAFFFGQQPIILSCAGFLLNSRDFNWYSEWMYNYQTYLRGSACVKSKSRVYLGFKNHIAVGYLMSTNVSINASQENTMGFNFTMLLTNFVDYSRYNQRSISDTDDTGYTVKSTEGGRPIEFVKGKPDSPEPPITYVDFLKYQVTETKDAFNVMPSIDMLNSTWWLPDAQPLNKNLAFQELSILQYMEENGVSREEAQLAGLQGKLLSSDPDNLKSVENVFARNPSSGVIVT